MILEHAGEHTSVVLFNDEEQLFFKFLDEIGYEPTWASNYLISVNSVAPFENFNAFLAKWGVYRSGNLRSV